jgi:predicted ATPase
MIKYLRLKNFKCFVDQKFRLGNLTLLSGLNSVGKSSVIQSLLLLRQSYQQGLLQSKGLLINGELIDLGTAQDIFYEGAAEYDSFGFDISFDTNQEGLWSFRYNKEADVVDLISEPNKPEIYAQNLFNDNCHYLAAERIGPRSSFTRSEYHVRQRHQIGSRAEYAAHYLSVFRSLPVNNPLLHHPNAIAYTLEAQVEAWMREVSPGIRINPTEYQGLDVVDLRYSFEHKYGTTNPYRSTNVGFGITYTLPIIVALLSATPETLLLLENPEAHLHPQGQARMGELIARASSSGVQILVETHSDHVLNGIRIAIHDGVLSSDKTVLYYLRLQEKEGQIFSNVQSPKIDKNGRIDKWPDGFFDEWDKSLDKLLEPREG